MPEEESLTIRMSAAFVIVGDVLKLREFADALDRLAQQFDVRVVYRAVGEQRELRIVREKNND